MSKQLLIGLAVVASLLGPRSWAVAQQAESSQNVVVHFSHFTDDLHRPFMALEVACLLQRSGASVTLFLDIEGVRLAEKSQSLDLAWGPGSHRLSEHYKAFRDAGGRVVLCPHCARAAGLDTGDLRPGTSIASEQNVAAMLLAANKILDY